MTLKNQLLLRLKEEGSWISGSVLERNEFRTPKGGLYKPSTISRCLREMTEPWSGTLYGRIEKRLENRTIFYKYIPSKYEAFHNNQQLNRLTDMDLDKALKLWKEGKITIINNN